MPPRMGAAEHRVDVGGLDVAEADATLVGLHLDQRLEPEHPARAVAHHAGTGRLEGRRHLVGPDRGRGRVAGDVDRRHRAPALGQGGEALPAQPAVQAAVEHPRRAERAVAQAEDLSHLHVVAEVGRARPRVSAYNASAPTAWQASARHRATVCAGGGCGAEVRVERDHAVDVGDRQVEHVGDRLDVLAGDVAELLEHVVQDRHQGSPVARRAGWRWRARARRDRSRAQSSWQLRRAWGYLGCDPDLSLRTSWS